MRYFLLIKVNSLKSSVGKSALVLLYGLTKTRYSLCGCRRLSPSIWRQNRRGARRAERQKIQKPQNTFFGLNPLFAQKLGLESIRGESLEFFQLKTPLKLFSMGTFWGPKKFRKFLKIPGFFSKNREKKPGTGEKNSRNRFFPLFYA